MNKLFVSSIVATVLSWTTLSSGAAQESPNTAAQSPEEAAINAATEAINRYESAWSKVQALTFVLTKYERMRDGRLVEEEVFVKQRRPGQLYAAARLPRRGQEIIYDAGKDSKQFIVHPGRFPDVTLHLELHSSLATKNQHHIVTDLGLDTPLRLLRRAFLRVAEAYTEKGAKKGSLVSVQIQSQDAVEKIVFTTDARAGTWQRPKIDDEPLLSFAERHASQPFLVFYRNETIDDVNDTLEAEQAYFVPLFPGSRVELMLDKKTDLPRELAVWDHRGQLFERYVYREVDLAAKLTDRDFDPDNPDYGF